MLKLVLISLFVFFSLHASDTNLFLYKLEKGSKKLGHYSVEFNSKSIISKSFAASNRLEMFSSKEITYLAEGYRSILFVKNKKVKKYNVFTNMSLIDEKTYKKFERKFRKVKGKNMLFITEDGKKGIELFNKRAIVLKTIDEVLVDIYHSRLTYKKFILFDKLGVMKMIAKIQKVKDGIIIRNAWKKKDYIKIEIKDNLPVLIKSMVSNWKGTLVSDGILKKSKIENRKLFLEIFKEKMQGELTKVNLSIRKLIINKSNYGLKGQLSFSLPLDVQNQKVYQQKKICKKLVKELNFKVQKVQIKDDACVLNIKLNIKKKEFKNNVIKILTTKYPELKITKNIEFNKNNIIYRVVN